VFQRQQQIRRNTPGCDDVKKLRHHGRASQDMLLTEAKLITLLVTLLSMDINANPASTHIQSAYKLRIQHETLLFQAEKEMKHIHRDYCIIAQQQGSCAYVW
jgi:hypothetical protein